jgi:hypothetical protein
MPPYFRAGRFEWAIAAVLLVGLIFVWLQPAYGWVPLIVMAYAVGYYTGRRSAERRRPIP